MEPDTEKQKKQKIVAATASKSAPATTALHVAIRIVPENAVEMDDSAARDQAPDCPFASSSSVSSASGSTSLSVPSRQASLQSRLRPKRNLGIEISTEKSRLRNLD